jgi:hypothetical protein
MDEHLVGGATGEGIDDISISHVGELVPLLRKAFYVHLEGFV